MKKILVLFAVLLVAVSAWADPRDRKDVPFTTMNSIDNSTAVAPGGWIDAATCFFTTGGAVANVSLITIQSSNNGTAFTNVTSNVIIKTNDSDTKSHEIRNRGGYYWRTHAISNVSTASTIAAQCTFWLE